MSNNSIFRQKSLDRISSPEELNSYMKVANPSVWIILLAVVLILAGAIVWGIVGRIETKVPAVAVSSEDGVYLFISEQYASPVEAGMKAVINDVSYDITYVSPQPYLAEDILSDYSMHAGNFSYGEYVYYAEIGGTFKGGTYSAEIVTESLSALTFLWN